MNQVHKCVVMLYFYSVSNSVGYGQFHEGHCETIIFFYYDNLIISEQLGFQHYVIGLFIKWIEF